LYRMGCLLHEVGNPKQSAELLGAAVAANPAESECHNALATVLFAGGRETEAERSLRQAILLASKPHFHLSLAGLLRKQSRNREALAEYETALSRGADPIETGLSIGRLYAACGDAPDAQTRFREILAHDPRHAGALWSLRESLEKEGRKAEATQCLDRAFAALPLNTADLRSFADALQMAGDFAAASVAYRKLHAEGPASAETWFALGCAETSRSEFAGAVDCFERVLAMRPDWNKARHNLGRALFEIGRLNEAAACLRRCAEAGDAGSSLARSMLATIVPGVPQADNQAILNTRRDWVQRDLPSTPAPAIPRLVQGVPLRIGYVSSFFHRDNWMKPVWGLINQHDRSRVEVHLFADVARTAIVHGYREHPQDRFHDTRNLDNPSLQGLIAESGVQVLIDLNGYSNLTRLPLFQRKLAPVTIGWFNMYATTGLPGYDYLIGDADVIPDTEDCYYSERILRVQGSYLTFDVDYPVPPVAEAPCLRGFGVAFGSLCSLYKITPEVIATWSRIVAAVPGSTLLLKNASLKSEGARAYLREQFARCGVTQDRVHLEGPAEHFEFLQAYDRIDLALDTFPYNGGTSTTEAIWQGVPVLTFAGDRWASRTSASILRAAGLGDFVAPDCASFVSMAARLGMLPPAALGEMRAAMRPKIRESAACDTPGFARRMESIYFECVSRLSSLS